MRNIIEFVGKVMCFLGFHDWKVTQIPGLFTCDSCGKGMRKLK